MLAYLDGLRMYVRLSRSSLSDSGFFYRDELDVARLDEQSDSPDSTLLLY